MFAGFGGKKNQVKHEYFYAKALDDLLKKGKSHGELKKSIPEILKEMEGKETAELKKMIKYDAEKYFNPLKKACETKRAPLMIIALDTIHKLIMYSLIPNEKDMMEQLKERGYEEEEKKNAIKKHEELIKDVVKTVCECFELDSINEAKDVHIQIIKALVQVVTSYEIHGKSITLVVQCCLNIHVVSPDDNIQRTSHACLNQILTVIFQKMDMYTENEAGKQKATLLSLKEHWSPSIHNKKAEKQEDEEEEKEEEKIKEEKKDEQEEKKKEQEEEKIKREYNFDTDQEHMNSHSTITNTQTITSPIDDEQSITTTTTTISSPFINNITTTQEEEEEDEELLSIRSTIPLRQQQSTDTEEEDYREEMKKIKTNKRYIDCKMPIAYLEYPNSERLIIISHGNATDIGLMLPFMNMLHRHLYASVLMYDYPGYGLFKPTTIKPSESNVYASIDRIVDYAVNTLGYAHDDIILFGISLGSGPSTYMATKYKFRGLILQSPFSSVVRTRVNSYFYSMFEDMDVFLNFKYIPHVQCKVAFIHGSADALVPFSCTETLFHLLPPKYQCPIYSVYNAGHNDIIEKSTLALYTSQLETFLSIFDDAFS